MSPIYILYMLQGNTKLYYCQFNEHGIPMFSLCKDTCSWMTEEVAARITKQIELAHPQLIIHVQELNEDG